MDIYLANRERNPNILYRNGGDGIFYDVSIAASVAHAADDVNSMFGDYDNDGDLDIFIAVYGSNVLYRNNDDGTFTDVASQAHVDYDGLTRAGTFTDYDGDGDIDLYICNKFDDNILYENNGDGTFKDVTERAGVAGSGNAFGVSSGDLDNDGDFDLYVTNHFQPNILYRNNGDGTFSDIGHEAGVADPNEGRSAAFGDYDNDGYLDMYMVNYSEPSLLYHNNGDGTFSDVSLSTGTAYQGLCVSVIWGDYDNDGDLDLFLMDNGERSSLFRNNGSANHWLIIKTVGTMSNRDGIGAQITVYAGSLFQVREVIGGFGFDCQNSLPAEFGLGHYTQADSVIIRWPSGIVQVLTDVPVDQYLEVTEEVTTPLISIQSTQIDDSEGNGDGMIDPGETMFFIVTLQNRGLDAHGVMATLSSDDFYISITQDECDFGDMPMGGTAANNEAPYVFTVHPECPWGRSIAFVLEIRAEGDPSRFYVARQIFVVRVAPLFTDVTSIAHVGDDGTGYGIAWGDYEGDGYLDMYIANDGPNVLYHNNGDGTFTEFASPAGVDHSAEGTGPAFLDYDNDRDLDIFVTNYYTSDILYRNNGDGTFTDVTVEAGIGHVGWNVGSTIADYNGDGFLDIYVSDHVGANILYKNNGDGTFTNVASEAGVDNDGLSSGVVFTDYDNDGDEDLYVGNQTQPDVLYRNNGDGTFSDVTSEAGLGYGGESSCPEFGDYDNDGDFDLYLCNYGYYGADPNILYRNNGDGTFTDVTLVAGVGDSSQGADARFGDVDNDGDLDIYVSNRGQGNVLYRNEGGGIFTDISQEAGVDNTSYGTGMGFGDYDNDGDLDIYVVNYYGANTLFRNNIRGNHWLVLRTVGTLSNRDGVGARVEVVAGDLKQVREVRGRSGLYGQSSLPVEFGLGQKTKVDSIIIRWPSGIVQVLTDVQADQYLTIVESAYIPDSGWSVPLTITGNSKEFIRTFSVHGGGTGGYDAVYDSICPPPGFEYYTSFWIDDFPHWLCRDTKEWPPSDETQPILRWLLKVVNAEGMETTVWWEPDSLPCEEGDFTLDGVDMCSQSSYSFLGNRDIVIEFRRCVAVTYDFDLIGGGWYLISLPVDPVECMGSRDVHALFPSVVDAYGWESGFGYYRVSHVEPKRGYWLAVASACSTTIRGYPTYCYAEHFGEGWHLIGSVMDDVDFSDPCDSPDGSVLAGFGWDPVSDYYAAQTLVATEGYWIAVGQECVVAVGCCPWFGSVQRMDGKNLDAFQKAFGSQPPPPPFMIESSADRMPEKYVLHQNYPNPFNPVTTIEYMLPEAVRVKVEIYNTLGQVVEVLVDGGQEVGYHSVMWDGSDVSSGVYFCRLHAVNFVQTKRMLLLK